MSDLHLIEKVQESNSRTLNTSSLVQHHIEKKLMRSIGNFNTNGASLNTTTAISSSSAKFSVTSTTEGKSVVSSLSMSLERKSSIQYIPKKIAPCAIPAGQNTVIHLDNYAHFMAQRFTTTKAAVKREEIITGGRTNEIIVPAPTSNASKSSGIVDFNLKVLSGGVSSSYHNNNKAIVMNKQKLLDQKSLKIRGRKNSLALELKLPKEIKKVNNIMADKTVTTPILKKPKVNRRKKVIKPRSSKKIKIKTEVDQDNINKEELEKSKILPIKQPSNTSKELRPCLFTLQRKKCLSEMTCPYLHSDFPCKYYYLNLICPQGFNCQFMHNGPLEPKLIEALRNHILDLLSTKPTSMETLFVQQIHNIEDLAQRLQSFQTNQGENHEVIEVVDAEDDEQQLVIDESSNEIKTNNLPNTMSMNSIFNLSQENDQTLTLQPTEDKLDLVYENFKDTNIVIDEIDQKLKNLKSTSNMTTNEKMYQLQNIYQLIKEQEKRLPIYKHLSTPTSTKQISTNYDNSQHFSNSLPTIQSEEPHIVLVNPDIINEIQISDSQENAVVSISDDENTMTIADNDRIQPHESGIENPTIEELPPQGGTEILTNKHSQQQATDNNNDNMSLPKESDINEFNMSSNFDYEAEPKTCLETILDNSHLNKNNYEELKENFQNLNKKFFYENEEILAKNNSHVSDITENVEEKVDFNNSLLPHNETLEFAITNDEKEVIESHVEMQLLNEDDMEEQSPSYEHITTAKPKERSRLRLRSHTLQNNEEVSNKANNNENSPVTSVETKKPIRNRRLRLPKPSQKTTEKSNNEKFESNGEVINKPLQSAENTIENTENKKEINVIQDVEVPLTQNVIVTKRFLKRVKAKQSLLNEETNKNSTMDANVEQNIMALHCEDHENINSIENINVTLLTETSDDTNSLNLSQDPLILESDCESIEKINNEIMSGQCFDNRKTLNNIKRNTSSNNLNLPTDMEKWEAAQKPNSKRRISFENPLSSLVNTTKVKEQFNLGNPHVVLAKLKPPFLLSSPQKELLADSSATTNDNPIVTSPLLADAKPAQKRHSFTSEYDLDSSLKENKCLKIDYNSKSMRRVKIDNRKRTNSQQSSDSKDGDIDIDSCDEKLTIVDVIQISSPSTGREQKTAFEPFSTHVKTYQKQQQYSHSHQHVYKEQQQQQQQENDSDLSQQIENISNKSDLQLQTQHQQQQRFVQREEDGGTTTTTATSFITKNSNNIPNEQHQQEEEEESQNKLVCQKQYENNKKMEVEIANTCNPYGDSKKIEDGRVQSPAFERIYKDKEATSNSSNKYSNETTLKEKEINDEYSTFSSLYNKLSAHSKKCQINFENSSVNITPISSPTYNDDTIASPSPVRKLIDFRMGGEIDGRLTNPPIPYVLHEIDLVRIQPYKTICVNKLKTTIQMDPRMLRTYVKKQLTSTSTALVPITSSSNNLSHHIGGSSSSHAQPTTTVEVSPYDPRNRASAVMRDIATPSLSHQHETALTPYNNINVAASSSTLPSSLMCAVIPNAVPLSLQYNSSAQPIIIQPQQQQTPNMFLYGCLQRSPWYQGLMSTMKIQINQSISQLVRALNNFHRERLLSPEMVFDVFKIDCAGELLEIMRNLGIFVDANGIINEQRKVPSFGGRSCCNSMPVNATYSFIQQVLTPNTQCTSLTTASSTYNAAGGTPVGQLNVNEPFVSCYIKAPEQPTQKQSDDNSNTLSNHSQHDDNSGNRRCNGNCNSNRNDNYNNNNNNYNNKRFGNQYKKPYDNNNGSSNYQLRSNQRSSYNNNNPRFNKPGSGSPNRSNSSPPNSPRNGGGGRGGGGRFNNNRRFNNYNNNDNNYNNNGSSWSSSSGSNDNRFNNKYQNNNSPTRNSSPKSSFQTGSPKASSPQPASQNSGSKPDKKASTDEDCWDSDN